MKKKITVSIPKDPQKWTNQKCDVGRLIIRGCKTNGDFVDAIFFLVAYIRNPKWRPDGSHGKRNAGMIVVRGVTFRAWQTKQGWIIQREV